MLSDHLWLILDPSKKYGPVLYFVLDISNKRTKQEDGHSQNQCPALLLQGMEELSILYTMISDKEAVIFGESLWCQWPIQSFFTCRIFLSFSSYFFLPASHSNHTQICKFGKVSCKSSLIENGVILLLYLNPFLISPAIPTTFQDLFSVRIKPSFLCNKLMVLLSLSSLPRTPSQLSSSTPPLMQ